MRALGITVLEPVDDRALMCGQPVPRCDFEVGDVVSLKSARGGMGPDMTVEGSICEPGRPVDVMVVFFDDGGPLQRETIDMRCLERSYIPNDDEPDYDDNEAANVLGAPIEEGEEGDDYDDEEDEEEDEEEEEEEDDDYDDFFDDEEEDEEDE